MTEALHMLFTAPLKSIFAIVGICFLLMAVGVSIKDKIEPDKWGRVGSAIIGAIFIAIGLSSSIMGPLETGVDRMGDDYKILDVTSAGACSDLCASESRCLAFTFRTAGNPLRCWLKEKVPQGIAFQLVTSWLSRRGSPFPSMPFPSGRKVPPKKDLRSAHA